MLHLFSILLTLKQVYAEEPLSSSLVGFQELKKIEVFDGELNVPRDLKKIEALSQTASSEQNKYPLSNLVDGKDNTAWVEAEEGSGVNTSLTFQFPLGENQPDVIKIVPGYLKSESLWFANQRVSKIRIRFLKGDEEKREVIEETIVVLQKENGSIPPKAQYIQLHPLYLQHMGFLDFQYLEITLLEIDEQGAKYQDTCISEIAFYKQVF